LLAIIVPLISGCGGGVAALGFLGSFFGAAGGGGSGGGLGIINVPGSDAISSITQPEPASMLLMGGGMAAMAYFKSKKKS